MGSYRDWLDDNWCYSCRDAHECSCEEYQEEKRYKEDLAYKKKKELINSIDSLENLYYYIDGFVISPFRDKETETVVKSILLKLIKEQNEKV